MSARMFVSARRWRALLSCCQLTVNECRMMIVVTTIPQLCVCVRACVHKLWTVNVCDHYGVMFQATQLSRGDLELLCGPPTCPTPYCWSAYDQMSDTTVHVSFLSILVIGSFPISLWPILRKQCQSNNGFFRKWNSVTVCLLFIVREKRIMHMCVSVWGGKCDHSMRIQM